MPVGAAEPGEGPTGKGGAGSLGEAGSDCLTVLKDASDGGQAWVQILALPFTSWVTLHKKF